MKTNELYNQNTGAVMASSERNSISKQDTEKSLKKQHMKTNELDEILAKYNDSDKPEYSFVIYKAKYIEEFKQQINKWALEKCLRVIGKKEVIEDDGSYDPMLFNILAGTNGLREKQREKARKEFSNE